MCPFRKKKKEKSLTPKKSFFKIKNKKLSKLLELREALEEV